MNIQIHVPHTDDSAAIFRECLPLRYDGFTYRPGLYLEPHEGEAVAVSLTHDHRDTNSTPMDVYQGRRLYVPLSTHADADELADWLRSDEATALLTRIGDGYSERWDGNNMRGHLTDDASTALACFEIAVGNEEPSHYGTEPEGYWAAIEAQPVHVSEIEADTYEPGDWFTDGYPFDLSATATDDEIETYAEEAVRDAETNGVYLDATEIADWLREERDELAAN